VLPEIVPELKIFVSVPCNAIDEVTVLAVAATGIWLAVMPERPLLPALQLLVVAPPFTSVHNVAPVPEIVPEDSILESVPCSATEEVTVLAVAAIGT
jgi:hypothetical protein